MKKDNKDKENDKESKEMRRQNFKGNKRKRKITMSKKTELNGKMLE